jgi:hypothetical protein
MDHGHSDIKRSWKLEQNAALLCVPDTEIYGKEQNTKSNRSIWEKTKQQYVTEIYRKEQIKNLRTRVRHSTSPATVLCLKNPSEMYAHASRSQSMRMLLNLATAEKSSHM